jgi:peptide/nickel transport system permease protein
VLLLRFIGRRLVLAVITLIGVATVVFFLVRLIPGNPARTIAGVEATPAQVERVSQLLGLNRPEWQQYVSFMWRLVRGNLGTSTATGDPVLVDISAHLPFTVELTFLAIAIGIIGGMVLGIAAAFFRGRPADAIISFLAVAGMSVPTYWLGLNLVLLFAVHLQWLPASGAQTPLSVVLPAVTLSTLSVGIIARMTRSAMLEVLSQDYIRTARAKGAGRLRAALRHGLPNAIPPILTVIGVQFGLMLGGAVLTESVFNWPGMGQLLVNSIFARDFPVVQGCVLLFSAGFIAVNLIVDILYTIVDPRISLASQQGGARKRVPLDQTA